MIGGGKSYVSAPPAFSTDAKRLLVCTGTVVSIFSTSTGLQIASLEAHDALVTSVIVVPGNKALSFCWTASLDGTLRYWDFAVAELMKTIDIKMPIFSMVIPSFLGQPEKGMQESALPVHVFAYLSVENTQVQANAPKALRGQIRKCDLTESRLGGGVFAETREPEVITVSPSGKFFGIRNKRKIHIWRVPAIDSKLLVSKKITLHHTRNLTVLAFHPTKTIVAAGDVSGRILTWRGFGNRTFSDGGKLENGTSMNNEEERPGVRGDDDADSCTTWHWHPAGISVLSFSSDGAYLYSGGVEGVLVVWQLDTGKKKFLPRIGSPLLYLTDSSDPSLSSVRRFSINIFVHSLCFLIQFQRYMKEYATGLPLITLLGWLPCVQRIIASNSTAYLMTVKFLRKKPMTAAAFSADGSVLAVAAETLITLWDPDNNALVAVIGEAQMPIVTLSFAGKSEYLVSVSQGSKPQLSVWSMSKLSESWSYKLHIEDVTCAPDSSSFAVLALLPKSSACMGSNEPSLIGKDGVILLFNATDPVPLAMWSVRKAKGGGLAFLNGNQHSFQYNILDGKPPQTLLVYMNGDHEYVMFDPYGNETNELSLTKRESHVALDETGQFGYASIYGELPRFDLKRDQAFLAPSAPSQRPWETLFSGSSHNLPPLTKLCSEFMESLLEKRTATVE
ncbi:uncharacterized protein LOC117627502 isoform X3 [Prunus dulcis]|uniref:uncharacterized protein LOC117627502 isoform X3 n=1 Tax=Prunus dulcis TaxID=3755 RepID=UPI001483297F|nr:uncharacterized protein LOC117627502 isoform X3 [Prunus dulcis]